MSKRRDEDIHEQETMGGGDEQPTVDSSASDTPHEAETFDGEADEAATSDGSMSNDEQATVDGPPASSSSASESETVVPPGFQTVTPDADAPTMESSAPAGGRTSRVDPTLPKTVGRYRIVRLIGAGGMGAVFEAEQDNPRRSVALKLMKGGIASKSALRRFEYESQLLGRLRHPGIAQVYEAGVHDDGTGAVPYFAMEYIPDARTLTEFAQKQKLSTDERLELFMKVCDAVHHGHQKGIIHRDLKPDNILVDSSSQPKIIDFGVARTTDSDIQAATVQTEVGQLVGTVPYMSPEQIEADPSDIDTRSDVYGLGVVLYRLLTGKLPYDLSDTPVYEATRIIKEQAPLRMSTMNHSLKGDVETIVFHALEKDRERRYQSALELEQDIQRYLNDEPIHARPASLLYTWSRFAKRNKLLVSSIAIVFVLLVGGVVGTSTGMVRAQRNFKVAVEEVRNQKKTSDYFFGKLGQTVDARRDEVDIKGKAADAKVVDFMDLAVRDAEEELGDFPKVHAAVLSAMAFGYKSLTNFEIAEDLYQKALALQRDIYEPPAEELALTLRELGAVLWWNGRYEEAEPLFRESYEMYEELADGEDEELARSIDYLASCLGRMDRYDEANKLYRKAMEMRRRVSTPVMVGRTMNNFAMCLRDQKKYKEAADYIAQATSIQREHRGDRHIDVANGLTNRASCLIHIADENPAEAMPVLEEAQRDLREALDIKKSELREDNTSIATTQYHLAHVLLLLTTHTQRQSLAEAEQLARAARSLQQSGFSPHDPRVIDTTLLLVRILEKSGDNECALIIEGELNTLKQTLEAHIDALRAESPRNDAALNESLRHMIYLYESTGDAENAQAYRDKLADLHDGP